MKRSKLFLNTGQAILGLLVLAMGLYLTIQANIGLAPWDCLCMGISGKTGFSYGQFLSIGVVTIAQICIFKRKNRTGELCLTQLYAGLR